jgi:hypothetical protein
VNQRYQSHVFLGDHAPLVSLASAGFLIMGTGRTAYALVSAGALLWVYVLTVLVMTAAKPALPVRGKTAIRLFVSSFWGCLFLLFLFLINPVMASEISLLAALAPVSCTASKLCGRLEPLDTGEALGRAFAEALALGLPVLALALIREPLGSGSLSLPGGPGGLRLLFSYDGAFFPVRIIAAASGALILLGYGTALFRRYRSGYIRSEDRE